MNLNGKYAIVTGVSKGIGKAVSELLLEKGVIVFGFGRKAPDFAHPNFHFIETDVTNFNDFSQSFNKAMLVSNGQIDILVNNAGLGYFGFLEETTLEQWHEMHNTNVDGVFYGCKLVLPIMKKQLKGHIINIASIAALEGMPQVAGYCSTKWAVKGLSESLFKEVRDFRIKVTCIYPGSVKTDFFRNSASIKPHDYMLMPEDVATAIVQALEMPDNFHTVNVEIRPLQPKGPVK